jgi:hypothetical protein
MTLNQPLVTLLTSSLAQYNLTIVSWEKETVGNASQSSFLCSEKTSGRRDRQYLKGPYLNVHSEVSRVDTRVADAKE